MNHAEKIKLSFNPSRVIWQIVFGSSEPQYLFFITEEEETFSLSFQEETKENPLDGIEHVLKRYQAQEQTRPFSKFILNLN